MEAGDCLYGVSMALPRWPRAEGGEPADAGRGRPDLSLLAATAAEQLEKVSACGPPGKQAWLCSTVYDLTKSQRAAEVGDDLAPLLRVLVIVLIAYILVRITRAIVRRSRARNLQREQTGERISKIKHRTGLKLLDTSSVPSVRRALRAETDRRGAAQHHQRFIWATAMLMILEDLGVNLLAAIGIGASIIGVAIGFGFAGARARTSCLGSSCSSRTSTGSVTSSSPASQSARSRSELSNT